MILAAGLLEGTLISEQIESEAASTREGIARYRRAVADAVARGQGGGLKHVGHYTSHWMQPCTDQIVRLKRSLRGGDKAEGSSYIAGPVLSVPSKRLALATIETTLSQMMLRPDGCPAQILYHAIGNAVIAESYYDALRRTQIDLPPTTPPHILERKKTETARAALERKWKTLTPSIVNQFARANLEDEDYKQRVTIHTGCRLFFCLLESASAAPAGEPFALTFRIKKMRDDADSASRNRNVGHRKVARKYSRAFVTMDRSVWNSIFLASSARERLRPVHTPMLVPSLPWQMPEGDRPRIHGGYVKNRVPLVSHASKEQRAAMDAGDMGRVYEAVNALGSTKWRVNGRLAEIQRKVLEQGGGLGLPPPDDLPMPDRLPDWASPEEIAARNREAVKRKRENLRNDAARTIAQYTLGLCDDLAVRDALYFPHQLDWRGRGYAIPMHLSYYGADPRRALLEFAEPKMLTDDGRRWLYIAAANHFGMDKVSFAERVKWTEDAHNEIHQSAMDPLRFKFWQTAKKPWQFLAACMSLEDADRGMRFPVDVDGSCNGLQHYAAMLRDRAGGEQVNLVPGDRPGDVYSAVLAAVMPVCKKQAGNKKPEARMVLPFLSRDLVKQPVMTTVYGVTRFGMRDQIKGQLREKMTGDDLYRCTKYLTGLIEKAIGTVVESAEKAMKWLRDRAIQIVDAGFAPAWTSPIRMPVVQAYRKCKFGQIRTISGSFSFRKDEPNAPLRRKKQAQSLAPNFVHSVDASHMMRTAIACRRVGVDFAAVHDSYRSHAETVTRMGAILREEFLLVHEKPLLDVVAEEWREKFKLEIPAPPPCGDLVLADVLRSPYFFH